jgi:hypothetical protein
VTIATPTPATGCKLTVNGKTQTIDLDVSGNLAIPTYPNVKSTLDSFSSTTTNTSGITYDTPTDTTTIDNVPRVVDANLAPGRQIGVQTTTFLRHHISSGIDN